MPVIEQLNEINGVMKEIFEFTQSDSVIQADFSEYLSTIGARNISLSSMEKVFLPYIFERRLDNVPVLEMFLKSGQTKNEELVKSFLNAQSAIYEIKKILKNGFELNNLINEKSYSVLSLTKMTNFRGIYAGQYIVARIFEYRGDFYIVEIVNVLSHSQKEDAMKFAVMKLIQNPKLLYFDNPEKEEELKAIVSDLYKKFVKTFKQDIIVTTNKYADEIIGAFNDEEEIDLSDKGANFETYKFFHIKEFTNSPKFLENSLSGFSSHEETYDVAIYFDKERGLYTVPFYKTFEELFKNRDSVEDAKECVEYFLTNESIPDSLLKKVYDENKNFMEVVNGFLDKEYTFEELLKEYKNDYLEEKTYSSATILYCSGAFSQAFEILSTPKQEQTTPTQKVGRNESCPCGSGKKYKNCCGRE